MSVVAETGRNVAPPEGDEAGETSGKKPSNGPAKPSLWSRAAKFWPFNWLSPRTRIASGLTSIVTSLLLLMATTGWLPDRTGAELAGRERLCETIAIFVNGMLTERTPPKKLGVSLAQIQSRNESLLSVGLRGERGNLLLTSGDHTEWTLTEDQTSTDSQVRVPMRDADGNAFMRLELRFEPVVSGDAVGIVASPVGKTLLAAGFGSFTLFWLFLGRILGVSDSNNRAVPSRVRSALDTIAEGLLVLDRSGNVALANSSFGKLVGEEPEDLAGRPADSFRWSTADGTRVTTSEELPWSSALIEEEAVFGRMLRLDVGSTSEPDVRTFVVNCATVLGNDEQCRGVLVSFEDVTLLERSKAELARSKDAAETASRAKSDFLANMSHEIRTPMNAILGYTDVLRRGLTTDAAEQSEHLNTIHSSGQHLLNLINDILDLSKVEAGKLEVERTECPIHAILSETRDVLSVKASEKGITVDYVSDGPVPTTAVCDPTRLRQIVTNLTGNAIKFTEEGGVTILSRVAGPKGQTRLEIEVRDTGIGMTEEVCRRIFDPFTQADSSTTRKFGGTGLGLAISKNFAEALGGSITVDSVPGEGSVFTAIVMLGDVPAGSEWTTAADFQASRRSRRQIDTRNVRLPARRVLVVDDGESNRRLIELVLKKTGLRVDCRENGAEALEASFNARDEGDGYELILMDMQMPVLDGYTATGRLRDDGFTVPIIALTGNAMKGDEERCLNAGCTAFLSKPVDLDELIGRVADLLGVTPTVSEAAPLPVIAVNAVPAGEPAVTETRAEVQEAFGTEAKVDDGPEGAITSSLFDTEDDPEFEEIVGGFVDRLNEQIGAMWGAADAKDFEELKRLGHWLKGSGGTMGFDAFTIPAEALEVAAASADEDSVHLLVREIESLSARIRVPSAV